MSARIITAFDYPPIPIRCCDWSAVRADYDGGDPPDPSGHGRTKFAAIADLLDQEDDEAIPPGADEIRELMEGGA